MKYYYEYRNDICSLICELQDETINNYTLMMLQNNNIKNVVRPIYEQGEDGYERLVYPLGGVCTLTDFLASNIDVQIKSRLVDGFRRIWAGLDAYSIDERHCIWNFDYIYVDYNTGEPYVACVTANTYVSENLDREMFEDYITSSIDGDRIWYSDVLCADEEFDRYEAFRQTSDNEELKTTKTKEKTKKIRQQATESKSDRKVVVMKKVKRERPQYVIP